MNERQGREKKQKRFPKGTSYFPFPAKHRQILQGVKRFRGGERLQGLQGFLLVFGQESLGLLCVFAVEHVVAELEEDAEIEAEVGNLLDLLGRRLHRHGSRHAAGTH